MQKWTVTPHKTITRLILPSPPNLSENVEYLLLSSASFNFPALTAGYSSTVCTVQSCWVKEKIVQVIRKQTNKNRFFFPSPPPQIKQHHRLWITPWPLYVHIKSLLLAISFAVCVKKCFTKSVTIKYLLSQSLIFAMQGISRCRLLFMDCRLLEEGILTQERSCHMFDPNICWLRGSMAVWLVRF